MINKIMSFVVLSLCMLALFASSATAQRIRVSASPTAGGTILIENDDDATSDGPASTVDLNGNNAGELVILTANPQTGYRFVEWQESGATTTTVNPWESFVDGNNHAYSAVFEETAEGVVVGMVYDGTDYPNPGTGTLDIENVTTGDTDGPGDPVTVGYDGNQVITLTCNPDAGDFFFKWIGENVPDGAAFNNPLTFTVSYNPDDPVAYEFVAVISDGGDIDGDGMSDAWEQSNGLDPEDPADAVLDPDNDGLTNLQEFNMDVVGVNGNVFGAKTQPNNPDTDGDGMWDGWEAYWGLDPTDATGINGATGNPDPDVAGRFPNGDRLWNVATGFPGDLFTNIREFNAFTVRNGGSELSPDNFEPAILASSTDPFNWDTDGDGLPDGWEQSYSLDPTIATGADGAAGNPDGDQLYGTALGTPTAGLPLTPYRNIDEYNRWAESDFNSATINELGCTDPNNADTDGDGMPDGWEQTFGGVDTDGDPGGVLDDWNPDPLTEDAEENPDDDKEYVEATGSCVAGPDQPFTNIEEYQISAQESVRGATTHPRGFNAAGTDPDVDEDLLPDHWEVTFGYDPWNANTDGQGPDDGGENPDGDFMADDGGGNIHNAVYAAEGFDPRTSYSAGYASLWMWPAYPGISMPSPNTRAFTNVDEILGATGTSTFDCNGDSTSPRANDTDGDGMHDGWEHYVGLNPQEASDGGAGGADDGLSNVQEFQCMALDNMPAGSTWFNKIWPTDPGSPDTDGDQVLDGEEMEFNYATAESWNGYCYVGGGMNPCTVDTDGDHIPDSWEWTFMGENLPNTRDGMDATFRDSTAAMTEDYSDYDGDGLVNYQEYWVGLVYHWQYSNQVLPADNEWAPGGGYGSYDPLDLLKGEPQEFDWHYFSDMLVSLLNQPDEGSLGIPYYYMLGVRDPSTIWWSTTSPLDWDTDLDSMDDYYEAYHGLNPIYGNLDVYASKIWMMNLASSLPATTDIRIYPFIAGSGFMNIDGNSELPNINESLQPDKLTDDYLHTDPSPMWVTDISYQLSFANLYYTPQSMAMMWYFSLDGLGAAPDYVFSFECNEGYDTDNDNLDDSAEIVAGTSPGATDPLTPESPLKRRALYLDGNSAARTLAPFIYGEDPLDSYTVECWVRPENPVSGQDQILIERPILIPNGNVLGLPEGIRINFRLAIGADGRPYAMYNGDGFDTVVPVTAQAGQAAVLEADEWVHLAAVYDTVGNVLRLYLNGELAANTPSALSPANGYYQSGYSYAGPLVIGAEEQNPYGTVNGSFIVTNPFIVFTDPDLTSFYQGWIDEVRIWDGVRTQPEIRSARYDRLKTADVLNPESEEARLVYLYSFESLPDPDHSPVSPAGFSGLSLRPNDGSYPGIPWWSTAPDTSTAYNDPHFVQWIENKVAHVPVDPAYDSLYWAGGTTNTIVEIVETVSTSTDTNGVTTTTTNTTTNVTYEVNVAFPNSSNPYNFAYYTDENVAGQAHPLLGGIAEYAVPLFDDMLPLRGAVADEDVEMWDGQSGRDPYDTDGDGLPDYWEEANGLDPLDASGENGRYGDPDMDGLDNYAEYLANTLPKDYDTDGDGLFDYDQTNTMGLTYGQLYDDGDGMPNDWEQSWNDPDLDPTVYDADLDPDADGWSNYAEYRANTDPTDPSDYPDPTMSGTIYYEGELGYGATEAKIWFYQSAEMDGVPLEATVVYQGDVTEFSFDLQGLAPGGDTAVLGKLLEGELYALAFLDVDGVDGYSPGDPMGLMQQQPIDLTAANIDGVKFQLTDQKNGFWRYGWEAVTTADSYYVAIARMSGGTTAPVLERTFSDNRTFIHEGDFYYAGLNDGLSNGTWRIAVRETETSITNYIDALTNINVEVLATPAIEVPRGKTIVASQIQTKWTADEVFTGFDLQVLSNNTVILSETISTPYMIDGVYQHTLPWFTGDQMPDGLYTWRVRGRTGYGTSGWASGGRFTVDLDNAASANSSITGELSYLGKVTNGVFVVQACEDALFSGPVVAQITIPNTSVSGVRFDAPFTMEGLRESSYYLRGFIDQDGDRKLDPAESHGMVMAAENIYQPRAFPTPPSYIDQILVVRDVDYDTDRVADAWEIMNFGDITSYSGQDEYPGQPGFTVFDVFEMNHYYPWVDSDADSVSDYYEHFVYGSDHRVADDYLGLDLHLFDVDNDGYNDALEIVLGSDQFSDSEHPLVRKLFQIDRIYIEDGVLKVDYSLADGIASIAKRIRSKVLMNDSVTDWSNCTTGATQIVHYPGETVEGSTQVETGVDTALESRKFFKIDWGFE